MPEDKELRLHTASVIQRDFDQEKGKLIVLMESQRTFQAYGLESLTWYLMIKSGDTLAISYTRGKGRNDDIYEMEWPELTEEEQEARRTKAQDRIRQLSIEHPKFILSLP